MSANKKVAFFDLLIHDEVFRNAFIEDPAGYLNGKNFCCTAETLRTLLVIQPDDLESPATLETQYTGPRLCLDGIGCVPGDNRKKKPTDN